jgi:hypothetical protein
MLRRLGVIVALALVAACAPNERENPNHDPACPGANLQTDPANCGTCGHACGGGQVCSDGVCATEGSNCTAGAMEACYSGPTGSENIGACKGGTRSCTASGFWGPCEGEITPQPEVCGNGIDDNCSGQADEDADNDHDGFTTCQGDCCDNTSQCSQPELVNPGAFEAAGNLVDDDCDGQVDNVAATTCDTGLASNSSDGMDYARAMDLCQTATMTDKKWGVISATFSLADGSGMPNANARSIRSSFGTNVLPKAGASLFEIATGEAADTNDTNPTPGFGGWESGTMLTSSGYPADYMAAHGGSLPNAPGCPEPLSGGTANDPVMLTLKIRTPSNAKSFSLQSNFFSAEYPEWVCTEYNDFFVVLLDSTWNGTPANPSDKNLAVYTAPGGMQYPVGVNLATGDTGLFTQCMNGTPGCAIGSSTQAPITSCVSTSELTGTGLETPKSDSCNPSMTSGGGTGWLTTSGNVKGGEIITLRIAIWDTGDSAYSSLAVLDNFQWAVDSAAPGTIPQ